MHQILVNLCTNAWHALADRPGRIVVGLMVFGVPERKDALGSAGIDWEIAAALPELHVVCDSVPENAATASRPWIWMATAWRTAPVDARRTNQRA